MKERNMPNPKFFVISGRRKYINDEFHEMIIPIDAVSYIEDEWNSESNEPRCLIHMNNKDVIEVNQNHSDIFKGSTYELLYNFLWTAYGNHNGAWGVSIPEIYADYYKD